MEKKDVSIEVDLITFNVPVENLNIFKRVLQNADAVAFLPFMERKIRAVFTITNVFTELP